MPERVDFYVLESAEESDRYTLACRLAEKGFHQGLKVFVRTGTAEQAQLVNNRLWTFSGPGFVPHGLAVDHTAQNSHHPAEVLIGTGSAPADYNDMMISLVDQVPEDATGFKRIADLVINRDDHKRLGRERFKFWRQCGPEPTTHNL